MFADRVKRWWRRRSEKAADTYYEGPEPPDRLRESATSFANMYPSATRKQFVEMAAELAAEAYRSGWVRGFEWAERDPDALGTINPKIPPEVIADQIDPDWRWRPAVVLEGPPHEPVPEVQDAARLIRDQVAAVNVRARRF
jgi:hypothetical protein